MLLAVIISVRVGDVLLRVIFGARWIGVERWSGVVLFRSLGLRLDLRPRLLHGLRIVLRGTRNVPCLRRLLRLSLGCEV